MSAWISYNWGDRMLILFICAVAIGVRALNWISPEFYPSPPAAGYLLGALFMTGGVLINRGPGKYVIERRWLYGGTSLLCLALALTSQGPIFA